MGAGGEGDVLGLHIEIEGPIAAVPPYARILQATKGGRKMANILGIYPDHSSFQLVAEAKGARDVRRPDISCQPVFNVVGDGERIRLILERNCRQDGAEDFLLGYAHLVVGANK